MPASNPNQVLWFLNALRREGGGFAERVTDVGAGLWSTVSVIKTFDLLGTPYDRAGTLAFIERCRDAKTGGFAEPGREPTVTHTALGVIALAIMNRLEPAILDAALAYMRANATTLHEKFMLVAVFDECSLPSPPPGDVIADFQHRLADPQTSPSDIAMAATALVRAGRKADLPPVADLAPRILAGCGKQGWWEDTGKSALLATYFVVRLAPTIDLPVGPGVSDLLRRLEHASGGYADTPGKPPSAAATYMAVSIAAWLEGLPPPPIAAARCGLTGYLDGWLRAGGDPNLRDRDGWTPLLAAAARGRADVVRLLLEDYRADPEQRLVEADALPIYMAGQSGDLATIKVLLKHRPKHLDAISSVNGHTLLLQLAFYGAEAHRTAITHILDHVATDRAHQLDLLAATNVRGLNVVGMGEFWKHVKLTELLAKYATQADLAERSQHYHRRLLLRIASPERRASALIDAIQASLDDAETLPEDQDGLHAIKEVIDLPDFDINALGGELQQPPLVYAIFGSDANNEPRRRQRERILRYLLERGADPTRTENHPMKVGAVIRAAVLGRLDLLRILAEHMSPSAFANEMNVSPAVNGLTALHDAVHRALTAPPEDWPTRDQQIRFMVAHGARADIPDHTGHTQRDLAESRRGDETVPPGRVDAILSALRPFGS